MNATKLRDELFSTLHTEVLKPAGYRKKGSWSIRECDGLAHSFFLRSSRFNSSSAVTFWIDVQVFSERWHQLLLSPNPYKGPSEGTPCLLLRGLPTFAWPSASMKISSETNLENLRQPLLLSAREKAVPFLERCSSHTRLLQCLLQEETPSTPPFLEVAGLYRLLGDEAQARAWMAKAKAAASHKNELRFLELKEAKMWSHNAA